MPSRVFVLLPGWECDTGVTRPFKKSKFTDIGNYLKNFSETGLNPTCYWWIICGICVVIYILLLGMCVVWLWFLTLPYFSACCWSESVKGALGKADTSLVNFGRLVFLPLNICRAVPLLWRKFWISPLVFFLQTFIQSLSQSFLGLFGENTYTVVLLYRLQKFVFILSKK